MLRRFIIINSLLLLISVTAFPQSSKSVLAGFVADGFGQAVANAAISIKLISPDNSAFSQEIKTDSTGEFTFTNLAAGKYQVNVIYTGFGKTNINKYVNLSAGKRKRSFSRLEMPAKICQRPMLR